MIDGQVNAAQPRRSRTLLQRWTGVPLYLRIVGGVGLGVLVGLPAGEGVAGLSVFASIVLRLLAALAPALISAAILRALIGATLPRGTVGRMAWLLATNTLVAIVIGLVVANLLQPGLGATLTAPGTGSGPPTGLLAKVLDAFPKSLLGPLSDGGNAMDAVMVALAFGIALRPLRETPVRGVGDLIEIAFQALLTVLRWIIELIPVAVFCMVASIAGRHGIAGFGALGAFVAAVLVALAVQVCFYLLRVGIGSWVNPFAMLRGVRDALVMAFSTASSTATMPVTYGALVLHVGVHERSANLGALVGANFNNDGTALYEAVSALFVAQVLGLELSLFQQLLVVVTSVVASVGAAGIPEAGLVTMTLVFSAVGLPVEFIGALLVVDWFLDRCRTAVNVLGDVTVACLLDGRRPAGSGVT